MLVNKINLLSDDVRKEFNSFIMKEDIVMFIYVRFVFVLNELMQTLTIHPEIRKWKSKKVYMHKQFLFFDWLTIDNKIEGWELHVDENIEPDTIIITCGIKEIRQLKIDELFDNSSRLYKKVYKIVIEDTSINQFFT